jgi:hypothetical protein
MAIVEFSNYNKHGNVRTRRYYQEKSNLSINPKGLGSYIGFKLFKYEHKNQYPPSLTTLGGKTYIMPGWQEVLPQTRLEDINWVKPKVKRAEVIEHKFKSSSNDKIYTTKEHVSADGTRKYSCSCPGSWRAFDRRCKHIKSIEK